MSQQAKQPRTGPLDRILQDFRGLAPTLPEAAVPRALRQRAAEQLAEFGWPSTRDEHWKHSNLRAFEQLADYRPVTPAPSAGELPAPIAGFERLVYVDGRRVSGTSRVLDTEQAAPTRIGTSQWSAAQRFGLLNELFATDSATLTVRGEAAIELLFITRSAGASYPRLQVVLEPGAKLTLIERHLGAADSALVCAAAHIELARDAQLRHYRLQHYGTGVIYSDSLSARLQAQSAYQVFQIAVGGSTTRTAAQVQLTGRDAALSWKAIAVGRAEQVHDTGLKVDHLAPATRTEELFRGIVDERARVAFGGHILIDAAARGADARQSLRGLIEGGSAEIDLMPRLEINTDDVKAQHGATTGRLDETLLFYLLSRGIDTATAHALLKWAFLSDVLRDIELPALRAEAERSAAGALQDILAVGALT